MTPALEGRGPDAVLTLDPGSFRDPTNAVHYVDGEVRRGLSGDSVADWTALAATTFFRRRMADGALVPTEAVLDLEPGVAERWPVVLRHDRVPVVCYPYEWTFSQLRDAALLHLDLLLDALAEGLTMKDGYSYNVQWRGARPQFIDLPSFERARGGPWVGYRQFCQTFLYPLLLQAHRGISFRPLLRGQVAGIEPRQAAALLGGRDVLRRGVLRHVTLHSAMDARFAGTGRGSRATRDDLRAAGFSTEITVAMATSLRKLVAGLGWREGDSHWRTYRQTSTYSDDEQARKAAFVDTALGAAGRQRLVLDFGCNDGTYSRVAARHAEYVVAVDADEPTVDALYRSLRGTGTTTILPLVMDLTDPSPAIGWRNRERPAFTDRVSSADTVLALALVHHLAIAGNVPLAEVVEWLWHLAPRLVVEFVDRGDPMTERLLANKPAGLFPDYRADVFERLLTDRFEVERREPVSATRTLYAATRRP